MAKQKGIIKLEGTIGDISFYKSDGQHLARAKGGVDGDRIKNDPAFARTRENGSEFGRAGKTAKLIRNGIRPLLLDVSDKRMTSRFSASVLKAIQADTTNDRGLRNMNDGNPLLLEGFEFNSNAQLSNTLYAPYQVTVDRSADTATVSLNELVTSQMVLAPAGATHLRFQVGAGEVDFVNERHAFEFTESGDVAFGPVPLAAQDFTLNIPTGTSNPILVVFGISFYQEVNGKMYPLKNGSHNALALVKVDLV